jgi:hypothetical protein
LSWKTHWGGRNIELHRGLETEQHDVVWVVVIMTSVERMGDGFGNSDVLGKSIRVGFVVGANQNICQSEIKSNQIKSNRSIIQSNSPDVFAVSSR